ncbi:MAG TPA: TIGR03619 family F420-dependent LLM class oxidoreductase, partial [Baekduia sp.]|nr:TIGR03619 family F420-dependent LLM class oxidoreductase [Baekduia sp.]
VLVLPQRDPVLVAKQAATVDVLSGGRVTLGLGAGWMREEFEILGWDFKSRGRRLEEAMQVMRACWEGAPAAFEGEFFSLPDGVMAYPRPVQEGGIPLLVGGMADVAVRRAGRLADGWLALEMLDGVPDDKLPGVVERLGRQLELAQQHRPSGMAPMDNVLAVSPLEDRLLPFLRPLADLGFNEIVIDGQWDLDALHETIEKARDALR